jgi:hypothetical protein
MVRTASLARTMNARSSISRSSRYWRIFWLVTPRDRSHAKRSGHWEDTMSCGLRVNQWVMGIGSVFGNVGP